MFTYISEIPEKERFVQNQTAFCTLLSSTRNEDSQVGMLTEV